MTEKRRKPSTQGKAPRKVRLNIPKGITVGYFSKKYGNMKVDSKMKAVPTGDRDD